MGPTRKASRGKTRRGGPGQGGATRRGQAPATGSRKEQRKEARNAKKEKRRWGHEIAQQWRAQQKQRQHATDPTEAAPRAPVPAPVPGQKKRKQAVHAAGGMEVDARPIKAKQSKRLRAVLDKMVVPQKAPKEKHPSTDAIPTTPVQRPTSLAPSSSPPTASAVAVYLPPQLRKASPAEDKAQRLRMSLRALFNKLSEGNLASILQQVLDLQATSQQSRHDFTQAVCDVMLDCTIEDVRLTLMIMYPFAALVRGLQLLLGNEVAAHCLRQAALRFQTHLAAGQRHQAYNALYLLCALCTFHVIETRFIYGVIHLLALGEEEIHVELLLLALKACGQSLRTDDPTALQSIIAEVNARQGAGAEDEAIGVRRRMMVGFINELRSKSKALKHSQGQYSAALWERLNRVVTGFAHKAQVPMKVSLDVPWETVVQPEVRGWWWEAAEMKGVTQRRRAAVEAKAAVDHGSDGVAGEDGKEQAEDLEDEEEEEEEEEDAAGAWEEEDEAFDPYGPPTGRSSGAEGKAAQSGGEAAVPEGGIRFKGRLLNMDDVYDMSDMSDDGEEAEGLEEDEEIDSVSDPFSEPEAMEVEPTKKPKSKEKAAERKKKRKEATEGGGGEEEAADLTILARAQSMTTPMKRAVFAAVMESVDIQECFVRLVKLDVHRNSRDMCAVLVQLCLQEKGYNPYYAALLHRLCSGESPRPVIYSTQCAIWTQFKVLSMVPVSLNRFLNLTHLILSLLLKGDISLSVLKPLDLHQELSNRILMFMRVFVVHLLHWDAEPLLQLLLVVVQDARQSTVRQGLMDFLTREVLKEETADKWLAQVLVTVDCTKQLPQEKVTKMARVACKALQNV